MTPRLHRAVELALEEVVAAHHGADVAGLRLEGEERPLGPLRRGRVLARRRGAARLERAQPIAQRGFRLELEEG